MSFPDKLNFPSIIVGQGVELCQDFFHKKSGLIIIASKHSMKYEEVNEKELKSTQICSRWGKITDPQGLKALGGSSNDPTKWGDV